jgi:hypothetical protein
MKLSTVPTPTSNSAFNPQYNTHIMKPIHFSKVLGSSKTLRMFRLALMAPAILITINLSQAGTPSAPAPAEEPELTNWIGFTIGGAFISGDDQGFMRRTQNNGDFYGGIDTAQLSYELNDSTTLTLDGHALPGMEDYEINIDLEKTDLGYIKAGFKQFRTWYDASPGYLEGAMVGSNASGVLDDERSIDRGEIYFEAGLRKEDLPEITFSYRHLYRDGNKDSTSWGDARAIRDWGGVTSQNPPPGSGTGNYDTAFKLMPALWGIDETTDIFELDIEHTLGNTDLGVGLVYESYSLDNTHTMERWGSPVAPATTPGINEVIQNEKTEADMFAGHIHSVTRFNDKAWLSFAASYSNLDTDMDGGTRSFDYSPQTLPVYPPGPARDYSYDQMSGGSSVDHFITNLNFMWVPVQDLTVTPSLRYEHENIDTISNFRAYNSTSWTGKESLSSNTDMDSTTGALDIRYRGIDNIVLFAKGEWGNEDESLHRVDNYLPAEFLDTDVDIDEQEYVIGANWYALSNLSFSLQGFHMERDQSLGHDASNQAAVLAINDGGANNFRPIMTDHNTETDDVNLRMTWRPLSNVSLVTRYDYCHTEYENKGIAWTPPAAPTYFDLIESGDVASHIVSQSVTWSPLASMYVQGTVSWISSETDTPEVYTGDSDNDSIVGSLAAGYAIDARTELTATYSYYQANNYVASQSYNGAPTMGYGYESEEHMIALTLSRVINESMIWNLRYGFITSNTTTTDQSGGYNDFDAHMLSTGLQVRF